MVAEVSHSLAGWDLSEVWPATWVVHGWILELHGFTAWVLYPAMFLAFHISCNFILAFSWFTEGMFTCSYKIFVGILSFILCHSGGKICILCKCTFFLGSSYMHMDERIHSYLDTPFCYLQSLQINWTFYRFLGVKMCIYRPLCKN